MKQPMSTPRIPQTDSIQELTDFEDQLDEVTETVFNREAEITIHMPADKAKALDQLAASTGTASADLVRAWVLERVAS